MPRKPREFSADVAYHIITRGNNRQALFRKMRDFERYLFLIGFLKSEFQFSIYHYCLMTNHTHFLMRFPNAETFLKISQRLHLLYAKYFAREYGHVGHVFQDRFKSFPIEDNSYLLECGRYIERNPLKAGMTDDPAEYKWSSCSFYAKGISDEIVSENPLFKDLADTSEKRRSLYRSFVRTDRPYDAVVESSIVGRKVW